ncbi:PREDICTED: LOW QUALITY PROTEIN: trafficking protein particle complex subunit 13-like [Hipposideros armiger]|uniref:LOW QUALITY PROTEIN: trafficking protein particle complex subunit 13-like n=1 Tax=Hipposideros armiger TaxID=186990 RepID=A0A8B7QNV4_HIPAR|nr:PREDICTED: LOW QUALITY PROTEIN: trafficking protein particle complex subunit 13-like [Hipposideros armiger]
MENIVFRQVQPLHLSVSMVTVAELSPNCGVDDVINDKIMNIGRAVPVHSVSIQHSVGNMFFRKLCLFPFLPPLKVKTKLYNSEMSDLFLEVQIQNISSSTVFIQNVSLGLSEMYTGKELNTINQAGEDECTFGTRTFLQSMDRCQYLYHLQIKQEFLEKYGVIRGLTKMGKLDIVWKRNLGEVTMLQTIQLDREAPGYENMKLSFETIPDTVILEEPFNITCKITNYSDRKMKLVLEMYHTDSIHWCGSSGRYLGKLVATSSLCITMTLLSLKMGLQSVSGMQITDKLLKTTYVCDDVAKVYVICSIVKMKS